KNAVHVEKNEFDLLGASHRRFFGRHRGILASTLLELLFADTCKMIALVRSLPAVPGHLFSLLSPKQDELWGLYESTLLRCSVSPFATNSSAKSRCELHRRHCGC